MDKIEKPDIEKGYAQKQKVIVAYVCARVPCEHKHADGNHDAETFGQAVKQDVAMKIGKDQAE
jgi:hypothetical protein